MAFGYPSYTGYPPYYQQPMQDPMAQMRQPQMGPQMMPGPMQPTQIPAANQPQPVQQQNSGIMWMSSKQEADRYLVAPGSAVALWDSNNPVIYLRQADSTGKPSTKVYDLVERLDGPQQAAPQFDMNRFVTWDKLDEYITERFKHSANAATAKEATNNG